MKTHLITGILSLFFANLAAAEVSPCSVFFFSSQTGESKSIGRGSAIPLDAYHLVTTDHIANGIRKEAKEDFEARVYCGGVYRSVSRWVPHDSADLAILEVDEALPERSFPRFPVSLDEASRLLASGECRLQSGFPAQQPRKMNVLRAESTLAKPNYGDKSYLLGLLSLFSNEQFLWVWPEERVELGDSGGGLICRTQTGEDVLLGVLSARNVKDSKAWALRLDPYLPWIQKARAQ